MATEKSVQWKNKSEAKLAARTTEGFNREVRHHMASREVQQEFSKKRAVFFKVRQGNYSAQTSQGKRLGGSNHSPIFSQRLNFTVVAVPDRNGSVKMHLDKYSKKNLQQIDRQKRKEEPVKALNEIRVYFQDKFKNRKR